MASVIALGACSSRDNDQVGLVAGLTPVLFRFQLRLFSKRSSVLTFQSDYPEWIMATERFFSRVKQDIFRPFTGRHRGIAFEVTVDLYDRVLGAAADYDLVLNRERLSDIVGTAIAKNRDLIVRAPESAVPEQAGEDEELDQSHDDREYARKLIARLTYYGIIESYSDATHLTVLWRFTIEGKRIAKMFSETRRRTSSGRQRSIRACRTALESFLRVKNHE